MAWPFDEAKLNRVRTLMKDQDLSALVVRAPDNVLYLTNYWCMKGYDAVVFPREGDPALIVLEPQLADAERNSWTKNLSLFKGYDERAIKTSQEIERMRLANELAALAMEHTREHMRPGMKESEVGGMYESFVHGLGVGYKGKVEMARAFTLVWSGEGIRTFTATGDRPIQKNEPTLFEIWVCVDGYWTDLTKNACPGELKPEYHKLLDLLLKVFNEAVSFSRDGASFPELDKLVRARIAEGGYPGQPSHPVCHGVGARAHEFPYAHQAGGGTIKKGMVLAIEPGIYWPQGGGLRLEDNFWITQKGNEKLCSYPDDFRLARSSAA